MARIFDVGPLPQISAPQILDTQPLIPFDLGGMAQSVNQKMQLDRQKQAMDLNYLTKFSDDLEGLLKSADGSFLNPISNYHKKAFENVASEMDKAIASMVKSIDMEDYKGAYQTMFEAKSRIKSNTDYKRTLQELGLFKDRLSEKDLDPFAINSLYEELSKSDKEFDLSRFNRSELALFDEAAASKAYGEAIKAKEASIYEAFPIGNMEPSLKEAWARGDVKYEVQKAPEELKQGLRDIIASNPSYERYLKNRGIDPETYINSVVNPHLLTNLPGAEYIYTPDPTTGKEKLSGIRRAISRTGVELLAEDAANIAKKRGEAGGDAAGAYVSMFDGPINSTQATVRNTPETVDFKSFRTAFQNAYNNYYNVGQAIDEAYKGKTIQGLVGSGNTIDNLVETVGQLGIDKAMENIKVLNPDGTVDQEAENRLLNRTLPEALTAYMQKAIYMKGNERLLEGSYDKIKSEFIKKGGKEEEFNALGITSGVNGMAVFPDTFDIDKRSEEYKFVSDPATNKAGNVFDPVAAAANKVRDIHKSLIDSKLQDRYKQFFEKDADFLQYWVLPQETGKEYAPMRIQADNINLSVVNNDTSFYSSDYDLAKGLPMTLSELTAKDAPKGIDKKQAWDNIAIKGIGIDPQTGEFFAYGFPRVSLSTEEYDNYKGAKQNNAFTNQTIEEEGSNKYLRSKKGIIIPWNKFGPEFYASYFEKMGSYEGLYSSMIESMEEKVPMGQPIRIDIGGKPIFITPTGVVGKDKIYTASVPGQIVPHVDGPGPVQGATSSGTTPVEYEHDGRKYTVKKITPTPEPTAVPNTSFKYNGKDVSVRHLSDPEVEAAQERLDSLGESKPYLQNLLEPNQFDYNGKTVTVTKKPSQNLGPVNQTTPQKSPMDEFLANAEKTTKIYQGDASAIETLLERGAHYINTLSKEELSTRNPLVLASMHIGLDETNPEHQKTIMGFLNKAVPDLIKDPEKVTKAEAAWCAAFVNNVLTEGHYATLDTNNKYDLLRAKNYSKIGTKVAGLDNGAKPGDIVVVENKNGGYHVGFYAGKKNNSHLMLGGNQNNKVSVMPIDSDTMKVVSVRRINDVADISPSHLQKIEVLTDSTKVNTTR